MISRHPTAPRYRPRATSSARLPADSRSEWLDLLFLALTLLHEENRIADLLDVPDPLVM